MQAEELELPLANFRCRNCGATDRTKDCQCMMDPRSSYAHRDPEAFITGYLEGWHQALQFIQLTGGVFAPTPFFQASPQWVAGQALRESITPMLLREMPWIDERFFEQDEEEVENCLSCGDAEVSSTCPSCGAMDCNYCPRCCKLAQEEPY
jgi:hypothetical protein